MTELIIIVFYPIAGFFLYTCYRKLKTLHVKGKKLDQINEQIDFWWAEYERLSKEATEALIDSDYKRYSDICNKIDLVWKRYKQEVSIPLLELE